MYRPICHVRLLANHFGRNSCGAVGLIFGISAPAILVIMGAGLDFQKAAGARSRLQQVVDAAALNGASMLRLANSTSNSIQSVVNSQVTNAYDNNGTVGAATDVTNSSVSVTATQTVPTLIMKLVTPLTISARAQAQIRGGAPTCLIALDPSAAGALSVDDADVEATGCQVFSNSTSTSSISLSGNARLNTASTCTSGGYTTVKGGSFSPVPTTDCPATTDPLAGRQPPPVDSVCVSTAGVIAQSATLVPGTYCGGLTIGGYPKGYKPPAGTTVPKPGPINVTLQSGTYVIKDGPLFIHNNANVTGSGVTVYFTGTGAVLNVQDKAILDLTAPSFGAMAGMLLFEDRSVPTGQTHILNSRNAPNLLGTVYLSRSTLSVGVAGKGGGPGQKVASSSAWTIIVARQFSAADQQGIVLNTNFGVTTVPPPQEVVGPMASVSLVQ